MPAPYRLEHTALPQDHFVRHREMARAHPELRDLAGSFAPTALAFPLLVGAQFLLAGLLRDQPLWVLLLAAYTGGAVLAHALYVLIHEATHDLVLKHPWQNKVLGIVANLPTVLPSAIAFRKFHLLHHLRMGEVDYDADLPSAWEVRLVKGNPLAKALWLLVFPFAQALRPTRMGRVRLWDRWTVANTLVVFGADALVLLWLGPQALLYLGLATLFGLGLHPLGARWIQEHFITEPGQETYSCYSRLGNLLAFNVGYHTEHHDFLNVPWVRLPHLRRIAPEFYRDRRAYRSWTALLLRFLFDPRLSAGSRITRDSKPPRRSDRLAVDVA